MQSMFVSLHSTNLDRIALLFYFRYRFYWNANKKLLVYNKFHKRGNRLLWTELR
jgi:hypothetical protein